MKQLTSIIVEKKDIKLDVELSNDFNILEDKSNFSNLKYLTLSNSNLKEIPNWIYKCTSLRYLDLSNNNLKELPKELFNLPLVYLDINGNKISKIDTQNKYVYIQANHSEFNESNYNTEYNLNKKSDYCIMIHDDNGHDYDRSEFEYALEDGQLFCITEFKNDITLKDFILYCNELSDNFFDETDYDDERLEELHFEIYDIKGEKNSDFNILMNLSPILSLHSNKIETHNKKCHELTKQQYLKNPDYILNKEEKEIKLKEQNEKLLKDEEEKQEKKQRIINRVFELCDGDIIVNELNIKVVDIFKKLTDNTNKLILNNKEISIKYKILWDGDFTCNDKEFYLKDLVC